MLILRMTGGLGNQLFQYAFFLFLKKQNPGEKIRICNQCYGAHNGYEIDSVFPTVPLPEISRLDLFLWRVIRRLKGDRCRSRFADNEFVSSVLGLGLYFAGFWQRLQYVNLVEKELRQNLNFSPFTEDVNRSFSQYLERTNNTVALHVRRGDYLKYKELYVGLEQTSYYADAIQYMYDRLISPLFIIFSDDMAWCKEHLPLPSAANVHYIDWNKGENSFRDMQLMSLCKHMIVANSTFSWWGAWLNTNPNKIIVTSKQWFVSIPTEAIIDIPAGWVKL